MDNGWDHTENEDKHLLFQSWYLNQTGSVDSFVSSNDRVTNLYNTRVGCDRMSDGYELISLSSESNKHLSSVSINKINRTHIFLYDLIPTNLSYFCNIVSNVVNLIFLSLRLLATTSDVLSNIESRNGSNSDISQLKDFLKTNKAKLKDLHGDLLMICDGYGYIHHLKKQLGNKTDCTFDEKKREIINKIISCLSEFDKIECLVISAKSTINEIKRGKDNLLASTDPIPPEHLKSVYFQINSWSNKIDRIFSAVFDIEINTWCLKYWICKFIGASNKNSLSSLSVDYIGYFYQFYSILIKTFPNLFPKDFLTFFSNLIKYLDCSLIKFKCYFNRYLSCISPSLISNLSDIQSLTTLVGQLPDLIKTILCNLQSAIRLNITLVFLHITPIWKIFICCNKEIHNALKVIYYINKLIGTKCNKGIIQSFQNCLNQIKSKIKELYSELHKLYGFYCRINCLKNETKEIIKSITDISGSKSKIIELIKRYKCAVCEFKCIECWIKCAKSIIAELKKSKQDVFKYVQPNGNTVKLTIKCDKKISAYIANVNGSNGKKEIKCLIEKIKCLEEKIEKTCSEFQKIEDNASDLKHLLLFTSHYLQISSYILEQLECIEKQQQILSQKSSELKNVESPISVISKNVREVSFVIDKINERRDDLSYIKQSLCSIIPKVCEIKKNAEQIKTKSAELQRVVEALEKIKSSIENLKVIDIEQKCLQIFDFTDGKILRESLICIKDQLDIKCITSKLDRVQTSLCIFEGILLISKELEPCMEPLVLKMNYIVGWINDVNKILDSIIKRFIQCTLLSLTANIKVNKDNKTN